jgi:hypothetical protein
MKVLMLVGVSLFLGYQINNFAEYWPRRRRQKLIARRMQSLKW